MSFLNFIFKWDKILNLGRKKTGEITLEACVEQGLLTKEEMLRIRKDRAIEDWEKESGLKERKTKR